jgi:hypothetical protein
MRRLASGEFVDSPYEQACSEHQIPGTPRVDNLIKMKAAKSGLISMGSSRPQGVQLSEKLQGGQLASKMQGFNAAAVAGGGAVAGGLANIHGGRFRGQISRGRSGSAPERSFTRAKSSDRKSAAILG